MASATSRPTFSFHNLPTLHPSKSNRAHLPIPLIITKIPAITTTTTRHPVVASSLDISKDDKPLPEPTQEEGLEEQEENAENFDPRRLKEKFAVLNTGIHECRSCGYRYDESAGDPAYPIPPGLQFGKLPEDWRCATCGAAKSFFVSKSIEIAGFAENQQFGLGTNTLTSGQKALLIYGSLLFAFALFLSGYFLQ